MKEQVATLAAGCFWCTEAVFQRLEGVNNVIEVLLKIRRIVKWSPVERVMLKEFSLTTILRL